ncbi:hypothetical protein D3C71_1345280 [compost metagenome]
MAGLNDLRKHLNPFVKSPADRLVPGLIHKNRIAKHRSDLFIYAMQSRLVEPAKRRDQFDLFPMRLLERLTGQLGGGRNQGKRLGEPKRCAAIADRRRSDPFQRLCMTNDTKVVLIPILIGDQIIHDDHPVQRLDNAGMPSARAAFSCLPLKSFPCSKKKSRANVRN